MNRRDRKAWRSARTLEDLGELVIGWLNGEIRQTPGHMGPPCRETVPLIPALTVINRGAFITDCSSVADITTEDEQNAWVWGFATDAVLGTLREATSGTPLELAACRRDQHGHAQSSVWRGCPWSDIVGFWAQKSPALSGELRDCWFVSVFDPEPGRNGLLWDTLVSAFAVNFTDLKARGRWAS